MSTKRHVDALLMGYVGPIFPVEVSVLKAAQDSTSSTNWHMLDRAAGEIASYGGTLKDPVTSDGYIWFWQFNFKVRGGQGEVAILFPRARDNALENGTRDDRSIAVYTKGAADECDASTILQLFIQDMLIKYHEPL